MNERTRPNDLPADCRGIPLPQGWTRVVRVKKGWSRERKYRVFTKGSHSYLLRVRPNGLLSSHQEEFDFVNRLHQAGIRVPRPYLIGQTQSLDSTYMLLDWMRGRDLARVLPSLTEDEQYRLGLEAGAVLRAIHTTRKRHLTAPLRDIRQKSLEKIKKFEDAALNIPGSPQVAAFVRDNIHWLGTQPEVCQHGDFHPGNLIYTADRGLAVIDFNRWDIGDPVEEFYKLQSFTIEASVPFAIGQLQGYFDGDPDQAFWRGLMVHVAVSSLYSIRWAHPFGEKEVQGMVLRYQRAMEDYQGFTKFVPKWYKARA